MMISEYPIDLLPEEDRSDLDRFPGWQEVSDRAKWVCLIRVGDSVAGYRAADRRRETLSAEVKAGLPNGDSLSILLNCYNIGGNEN